MKEYVSQFNTLEKFRVSLTDSWAKKVSRLANGLCQSLKDHVLSHIMIGVPFEKLVEMVVRHEKYYVDSKAVVILVRKVDDKPKFNEKHEGQGDKGGKVKVNKDDVICRVCGYKGHFTRIKG